MRNSERQFTRREFAFTAATALPLITGWSTVLGHDLYKKILDDDPNLHNNFPTSIKYEFPPEAEVTPDKKTKVKDAVFCASTVTLRCEEECTDGWYGKGSIVNINGGYQIYTIQHVADAVESSKSSLHIPGIGSTHIQTERIVVTKGVEGDEEQAAYYILGPKLQAEVAKAVEAGRITPLRHYYGLPKKSEEVVIPSEEKGGYQRYKFTEYNKRQNLMFFESTNVIAGENCQGDSGSPILRMVKDEAGNEFLTGEMYGVLQGSSKLYPVNDRMSCGTYFAARPNN